jgi:acyl carrier protein
LLNELNRGGVGGTIRIFISGGDRLKAEYVDRLVELEGTVVYNTYGPTEGTVCASYYRCRPGDAANVPIGKPIANYKLYITDRYGHALPVGVPGELCTAGPGVARGYLNQPELTAARFVDYRTYSFYKTGDLVCWLPDGNIEFLGRIDRQVKVRGYRIELGEIENQLQAHPQVSESVVVARKDAGGDVYLCAYIVPALAVAAEAFNLSELKEYLSGLLPGYMVPSRFTVLDKIPLTVSGKIDVGALPGPDTVGGRGYAAPRNELEERLEGIWQRVLSVEKDKIGIDADFFELGGHSLKATNVISVIHKELDVQVPLIELFNTPTIRGLGRYIREAAPSRFVSIEPVEKRSYYRLSPAQKRMYILKQMEPEGTGYNMPRLIPLGKDVDREGLERAFRQLISRHESLRTSFHDVDGEPVQVIHGGAEFEIGYLAAKNAKDREEIIKNFIRPFDLSKAPLLRVGLIELDGGMMFLVADMHHIVSDGISMQLLEKDFTALYRGEELPPLRIQYKDYANRQPEGMEQQERYWLKEFAGEIPLLNLPLDFPRPVVQRFEGGRIGFFLSKEETGQLKELASTLEATLYMVLVGALHVLLSRLSGSEDIIMGTAAAGRRHAHLEPLIGMFVNTLALRNQPSAGKTIMAFLREVKEKTLQAFENQDYPFEELVEKAAVERDTGRNPIFDVMFTLQNMVEQPVRFSSPGDSESPDEWGLNPVSKFDLTILAYEGVDELAIRFEYAAALFRQETIRRFIGCFKKVITGMVENPGASIGDIEIITNEEKQRILFDFNQTHRDYPRDKTIHELFAKVTKPSMNYLPKR